MRDLNKIKNRITGDIRELNRRLLTVSVELEKNSRKHSAVRSPPGRILLSFYRKAVNTSRGISVLKRSRLIEEAWILLRVLLEAHVNFFYFMRNDPALMCQRFADAGILDKLKHLKEVNYYEDSSMASLIPRKKWEASEAEIRQRYTPKEVKALRRHGYSGLSFKDRSAAIGMEIMYQMCHRIASRSLHTFDPVETLIYSHYLHGQVANQRELIRLRREQLERNQNMLLGRMSYILAKFVGDTLREQDLLLLGIGYEKYCDEVSGSEIEVAKESPESFFVWRV